MAARARSTARAISAGSDGGSASASSNIGFTSAIRSAPGAMRTRSSWGTAPASERYERSRVTTSIASGTSVGVEVAEVGALEHHDPRVLAQAAPELPVPDVDGVDARGARREQGRGEAARGGAGVERDPAVDGDPERGQGGVELGATPERGVGAAPGSPHPGGRGRRRW